MRKTTVKKVIKRARKVRRVVVESGCLADALRNASRIVGELGAAIVAMHATARDAGILVDHECEIPMDEVEAIREKIGAILLCLSPAARYTMPTLLAMASDEDQEEEIQQ